MAQGCVIWSICGNGRLGLVASVIEKYVYQFLYQCHAEGKIRCSDTQEIESVQSTLNYSDYVAGFIAADSVGTMLKFRVAS
jgi:hypothetical protein